MKGAVSENTQNRLNFRYINTAHATNVRHDLIAVGCHSYSGD